MSPRDFFHQSLPEEVEGNLANIWADCDLFLILRLELVSDRLARVEKCRSGFWDSRLVFGFLFCSPFVLRQRLYYSSEYIMLISSRVTKMRGSSFAFVFGYIVWISISSTHSSFLPYVSLLVLQSLIALTLRELAIGLPIEGERRPRQPKEEELDPPPFPGGGLVTGQIYMSRTR